MIRVLLADDEELVRDGLAMILGSQEDIEVVGVAGDGARAVSEAHRLCPDLVLMDVQMPAVDGVAATRQILRGGRPDGPRVLILTTFDADEYVYEALRAGASGFLLKDTPRAALIAAVRAVAEGSTMLAPRVTRRLVERYARRDDAGGGEAWSALSERELSVTRLVANGLSNAEIAQALHIGEATVKTHVAHALAKLGLRDRVQVVVRAYETGLVSPGDVRG